MSSMQASEMDKGGKALDEDVIPMPLRTSRHSGGTSLGGECGGNGRIWDTKTWTVAAIPGLRIPALPAEMTARPRTPLDAIGFEYEGMRRPADIRALDRDVP